MTFKLFAVAGFGAAALAAPPAAAHHSFAMFDQNKELVISGTVKEWQFVNPHAWLHITTVAADGKEVRWSFEGGRPGNGGAAAGSSMRKDTFKPGDKVAVKTHPMRDGRTAGSLMEVTFADGRVWKPVGAAVAGPPS